MKKSKTVILLILLLIIFSIPLQGRVPGRTYYRNNKFIHIIELGDTLYHLSLKYKINLNQLQELNIELEPRRLQVGDQVTISISPRLNYHVIQPGDTLWAISRRNNISLNNLIANNRLDNPDYILPGEVILIPEAFIAESTNIKIEEFEQQKGRIKVSGISRVFEATVSYALETKEGQVLKEGFTTATTGGPAWGDFEIEITDISPTADNLLIFWISPKDGSRQDVVKIELY